MPDARAASPPPPSATALARLLQFGDSMLPVGGFSFSCGLESAVQQRVVTDAPTLAAFTRTAVRQAAAGDGIALIHAHRATEAGDLDEAMRIDRMALNRKLSDETRTMSLRMGRKLTELGVQVHGHPLARDWLARIQDARTPGTHAVGLAVDFAAQGLTARDAFAVHRYGVAATILSAALRLMRIGHPQTQAILYAQNADVEEAYGVAAAARLEDMASYAPLTEILAAVHVKAHVRLFMN